MGGMRTLLGTTITATATLGVGIATGSPELMLKTAAIGMGTVGGIEVAPFAWDKVKQGFRSLKRRIKGEKPEVAAVRLEKQFDKVQAQSQQKTIQSTRQSVREKISKKLTNTKERAKNTFNVGKLQPKTVNALKSTGQRFHNL